MKRLLLGLIAAHCVNPFAGASPVAKLGNFELTDQEAKKRTYHFPKTKVTVMTVADQKGADQLAPCALFRAIDAAIADAQQNDPV